MFEDRFGEQALGSPMFGRVRMNFVVVGEW